MHIAQNILFNQFKLQNLQSTLDPFYIVGDLLSLITLQYPFLLPCLLLSPSLNFFLPYPPPIFPVYSFPLPYPSFILPCLLLFSSLNSFRQYLPLFPVPLPTSLSTHFPFPKLLSSLSPFLPPYLLLSLPFSPLLPSLSYSFPCPLPYPFPFLANLPSLYPSLLPCPTHSLSPSLSLYLL